MKSTQAGVGNIEILGHRRMPQKNNNGGQRPKPVSVPGNQSHADHESLTPLHECFVCKKLTRTWGSIHQGENHVCSKSCYNEYLAAQKSKKKSRLKPIKVFRKVKFVPGPDGFPWPEELLNKA